ncbi:dihydropteroate synthase [Thiosulfatimonas sediminis]|uniref:Dihydropteroate synthase n=1 Tax=Thiosulfatimonas sediminis TaxID=2675054 RepID=A0A6F8PWM3_9GAMM|nr:dihydropteroate synthase [Thiosulfatimonas sediminis]BBP46370.1 dihydropteroate synthase [Thiosulfatimonas sediminis]
MRFELSSWLAQVQSQRGRAAVMGILNITPDSFSDGGRLQDFEVLKRQVAQMQAFGVDMFDVGGESTRPGADAVSLQAELDRVLPVIEWIKANSDIPISIDTYKPEVMRQAVMAGASLINDVNALQAKGALQIAVSMQVPVCVMHKQGEPKTMQDQPNYQDVLQEVKRFLAERIVVCEQAGINRKDILVDLGFGFGKRFEDNTQLFRNMALFTELGCEMLVGVSRKRMFTDIVGSDELAQRLVPSVTAAVLAVQKGAKIVRVHDVRETVQALETLRHLN